MSVIKAFCLKVILQLETFLCQPLKDFKDICNTYMFEYSQVTFFKAFTLITLLEWNMFSIIITSISNI